MATAFLLVGLPAAGKTTRARVLERERPALRLTTDAWMVRLFGGANPAPERDAVEGLLLTTGLRAAALGVDVVLDFGFWSRDERDALRHVFGAAGVACVVEHLAVEADVQRERVARRWRERPQDTFPISGDELVAWRASFEAPEESELGGGPVPAPPAGQSWAGWASRRWPGFDPSAGSFLCVTQDTSERV
ncbi:ATP-binding protein [Kineococcus endophyticus]|uniref:ATP-binding protein n=1 Tax=Kineococcus endophyticus TaxID=1181883 RepID=A0ABV3P3Y6_9ACTN